MREMAEVFVLSGGEAAVLAHWKEGLDPNSRESKIFDGVMAYGEGKTLEAEAKLLKLDAIKPGPVARRAFGARPGAAYRADRPETGIRLFENRGAAASWHACRRSRLKAERYSCRQDGRRGRVFLRGNHLFPALSPVGLPGGLRGASCVSHRPFCWQAMACAFCKNSFTLCLRDGAGA